MKEPKNVTNTADEQNVPESAANATAVALVNEETGLRGIMTSGDDAWCSIKAESRAEKATLFNMVNAPDFKLKKCINQTILMKDLYMEEVTLTNEETGEQQDTYRIVIIDKDGKGYQCCSTGIFHALRKIIRTFGEPTWVEPIPVMPYEIDKGARSILSIKIVL